MVNKHVPVLKDEALDALLLRDNEVYIDATLGGGGYSLEILRILQSGTLLSLDLEDEAVIQYAKSVGAVEFESGKYSYSKDNVDGYVAHSNFAELSVVLTSLKIEKVSGIVADLGWSTEQLTRVKGLSFENLDAPLDMRFNPSSGVKASDLLKVSSREALENIFVSYADIGKKRARELVSKIKEHSNITTVNDLNELIDSIDNSHKFKSQVYQSLRIAVNDEYKNLEMLIKSSISVLKLGGRLVIITFHSGEDMVLERAVSPFIEAKQCKQIGREIRPSVDELKRNLKARSAKLFVYEKL